MSTVKRRAKCNQQLACLVLRIKLPNTMWISHSRPRYTCRISHKQDQLHYITSRSLNSPAIADHIEKTQKRDSTGVPNEQMQKWNLKPSKRTNAENKSQTLKKSRSIGILFDKSITFRAWSMLSALIRATILHWIASSSPGAIARTAKMIGWGKIVRTLYEGKGNSPQDKEDLDLQLWLLAHTRIALCGDWEKWISLQRLQEAAPAEFSVSLSPWAPLLRALSFASPIWIEIWDSVLCT